MQVGTPLISSSATDNSECKNSGGKRISFPVVFLLTISLLAVSYFALVTIVNPYGQFPGERFPRISPNSRGLKLKLLEQYQRSGPVDVLIMGSSRSMKLSPQLVQQLTGDRTFNASVFSGGPNDFLAMYRVIRQQGIHPKEIVLGLDVGFLGKDNQPTDDFLSNLTLTSALEGTTPNAAQKLWHWLELYKSSLRPYYIKDTALSVWIKLRPRMPVHKFLPDGHLDYELWDQQVRRGTYPHRQQLEDCTDRGMQSLGVSYPVSPELKNDLEQLVIETKRDNVALVLWITPLHPDFLARISQVPQATENFEQARLQLLEIANKYGLALKDLTDITSFGGDPEGWYDCVHYDESDAAKIAKAIFPHDI
jgi:hypothetical protein